jgi:hypothetical protein
MASGHTQHRNGTPQRQRRRGDAPPAALLEPAIEQLRDVTRQVKGEGERLVTRQKRRVARELQSIGESIHHAATELRKGPLDGIGRYADVAAERVARVSRRLKERDLEELVEEVEQVARRQPRWFLGGMFAAGFVLARFIKASSANLADPPRRRRRHGRRPAPAGRSRAPSHVERK